jgi:hypothetical protein
MMNGPSDDLFRIEELPASGNLSLESVNASLESAEAALNEKRRAFAEAAERRAELEAKLDEARAAYVAGRETREQTEGTAGGYRAAEQFAASVRAEADRNGEHDRALHERMVEERAAYEATLFLARSTQQRENEEGLEAERLDFERRLASELGRQASLGRECEDAEAIASALRSKTTSAQVEPTPNIDSARTQTPTEMPIRPHDDDERERKRRDLETLIAQLRANERAAAHERAEAERLLALLNEPPPTPQGAATLPVFEERQPAVAPAPQPTPARPPRTDANLVRPKPIVDGTVIAIAETILGLFARRPRKK